MFIEKAIVIKSAVIYYALCNLNNLKIVYNKVLINITINDLTAQKNIY